MQDVPMDDALRKEVLGTLGRTQMFRALKEDQLAQLVTAGKLQQFEANETILQQDQPSDSFAILLRGRARVYIERDGQPIEIGGAEPPELLGIVGVVLDQPRPATVTADQHYTGQYAGVHTWPEGLNGPTTRFVLGDEAHQDDRPAYFMRMCFNYDDSFHPGDLSRGVGVKGFGIYYEDGSGNANTCEGMSWFNTSCQFVGWGPSQKDEANDGQAASFGLFRCGRLQLLLELLFESHQGDISQSHDCLRILSS